MHSRGGDSEVTVCPEQTGDRCGWAQGAGGSSQRRGWGPGRGGGCEAPHLGRRAAVCAAADSGWGDLIYAPSCFVEAPYGGNSGAGGKTSSPGGAAVWPGWAWQRWPGPCTRSL